MLQSKYLLFAISLTFANGEPCQEPGLALVADGSPVDHLMLTEATEVMLMGEGECDVMVSYLAVGGGGGYFGAGGGSGGMIFGRVSRPAGGSMLWLFFISFQGTVLSIAIGQGRGFEEEVPGGDTVLMISSSSLVAAGGGGGGYGKGGDGYSGGGG